MNKRSKLSDTDLCVMCGMCLPHCPTYQLYQTESESPRGRIAIMQAIDQQRIDADNIALTHIDHCLGCLNCESICPSQVPYEKLLDEFRDQYSESISKPLTSRLVLKKAARTGGLEKLLATVNTPGLKQLIQFSSSLTGLPEHLLATSTQSLKNFYPATTIGRGQVTLFTGCTGRHMDADTLADSALILNQLGFDVSIPESQGCCGALHQHNGHLETARSLRDLNQTELKDPDSQAILFFSPACGSSLLKDSHLPLHDARSFINSQLEQNPLKFSSSINNAGRQILLHESCSHRNMLKQKTLNKDLLRHIPGIKIRESRLPNLCCGAGGLQTTNYPQQAKSLLELKLQSFDLSQASILLSDNIGCSQHMKSAISAYNSNIEVIHPISLLVRQLELN